MIATASNTAGNSFKLLSFAGGPTQQETRARPLHPVPAVFPAALLGPEPELHGGLSFLWAPQAPVVPGRHLLRDVPLVQRDAKEGRGDGQLLVAHSFISATATGCTAGSSGRWSGTSTKTSPPRPTASTRSTTIGGHDSFFALWPLFFNNRSGIGTTNEQWQQASIPAYSVLRSPHAGLDHRHLALLQLRG